MNKLLLKFGEILVAVVIVVAAGGVYWYFSQQAGAAAAPRQQEAPTITIAEVALEQLASNVEALGTASSREAVDITARVQEKVEKIYFNDGEFVKAGAVLMELAKDEAEAALKQAEINLDEEARELERYRRLRESNTVAAKEYDAHLTAHNRSQMLVTIARKAVSDRVITAPFDGILGKRLISVGDLVSPGTLITTIDDITEIKVDFNVPEKYFAALKDGLEFSVENVAYPGRRFSGKITHVGARLNRLTRNIEARGVIDNLNEAGRWLLHPGMLLVIKLNLGTYEAVTVPEKAVLSLGEIHYVYIYDAKSGRVLQREVTLGNRADGRVEITHGVAAGESFVDEGVVKLRDGMAVKLAAPAPVVANTDAPVPSR
jgi:membrane fusion protein (multidrug efflux system)